LTGGKLFVIIFNIMGRKKQGNGRNSNPKYLETKVYGGQSVTAGSIIVRQRGSRIKPGSGADIGRDYTIYSLVDGIVEFSERKGSKIVNIVPLPK
jgi:large subunit ribosomal protein L27